MTATEQPHLITRTSNYSAKETANRLITSIQEKELTVFARIDHAANAERVSLNMNASELILFGNPKAGTLLMQSAPTMGIDLPQKFLIWEDSDKKVFISHINMAYLQNLHSMEGVDQLIEKNTALLDSLSSNAAT
jgi:uncharacterized protein (DUF302 family)